ncbi:conglutin delta 2-like [Lotus japonicus]|uniref:conglutin delta 2-like n=1 Tax=Lotus japonicus TaxID=34305 RepID=UPI00258DE2B5|nr:conglutin delta 2-like [Lotus japonicus]
MAGLKVFLLAALLLVVVAHTATATASWKEEESCKKVNLKPCEKHIMQRIEQDEDQDHLKMRGIHYKIRRSEGEDEEEERADQWKQCCNSLRDLDSQECKCRALNKIMNRQSEELEGKEQIKDFKKELLFLPISCGMPPLFGCEFDN